MLRRPKLITFDVTGTLLKPRLDKYSEIGKRHGLHLLDDEKTIKSFIRSFNRLGKEHPIFGKYSGLGWQNWWRNVVSDVFSDQITDICPKKLDKVANSLIESYGTRECWDKFPGTVELLQDLKEQGLILGAISNFDERLNGILSSTDLRQYLNFVVTSYAAGEEKPSPLIFKYALKLLEDEHDIRILPDEALHIGDKLDNDYLGPREAGWNAVLVNCKSPNLADNVPSAHVFQNISELKLYLNDLLK